ncbi:MAG: 50S ribosomal protein L7/L12, partial [Clostridiales bacterium]|nr:50S ribosomal protein L7/L12 [Clostridiales bacterium]
VKELEEKFGVSAAAPVSAAAAPAAAADAPAEEQTEFDVILVEAGSEKIKVIKAVREVVSGLGLKEAKEFVESAPKTIKEGLPKAEAEKIKQQFEEVGAKIEIK